MKSPKSNKDKRSPLKTAQFFWCVVDLKLRQRTIVSSLDLFTGKLRPVTM